MITQQRVKELFNYDSKTGIVTRKTHISVNATIGDIVGHSGRSGYLRVSVDGRLYLLHRLIWLWMEGYFPEHLIDHIDRNKINNIWKNLRHVSHSCNVKNSSLSSRNSSGVKGVSWDKSKNKWIAYLKNDGRMYRSTGFKNFKDAVKARYSFEVKFNYNLCSLDSSAYKYLKSTPNKKYR